MGMVSALQPLRSAYLTARNLARMALKMAKIIHPPATISNVIFKAFDWCPLYYLDSSTPIEFSAIKLTEKQVKNTQSNTIHSEHHSKYT
jgi:hypothetical protein